jgi:nucleotide-binding universal stress UspA family protein
MSPSGDPVVVGVDDDPAAAKGAIDLGAWEANWRCVPLLLVHGYRNRASPHAVPVLSRRSAAAVDDAQLLLTEVESRARADHPGLTIRSRLVAGGGASGLIELTREAAIVVVGSPDPRDSSGRLAGSVAAQVAAHSHVPVIVVRPPGATPGITSDPVVVGVDGSEGSRATLAFAFEEAEARGARLVPFYAWARLPAGNLGPVHPFAYEPAEAHEEAARMLAELLAGAADTHADVRVEPTVVYDPQPASALIQASSRAGLVVVGGRRGGLASLRPGSVSHALVEHSRCPVAVVHRPY